MNGARSIFMRKGYWLTALAAIVLLAASPGTAQAQVTESRGRTRSTVTEGETVHVYRAPSRDLPAGHQATRRDGYRDLDRTVADSDTAATAGEADESPQDRPRSQSRRRAKRATDADAVAFSSKGDHPCADAPRPGRGGRSNFTVAVHAHGRAGGRRGRRSERVRGALSGGSPPPANTHSRSRTTRPRPT